MAREREPAPQSAAACVLGPGTGSNLLVPCPSVVTAAALLVQHLPGGQVRSRPRAVITLTLQRVKRGLFSQRSPADCSRFGGIKSFGVSLSLGRAAPRRPCAQCEDGNTSTSCDGKVSSEQRPRNQSNPGWSPIPAPVQSKNTNLLIKALLKTDPTE